MKSLVRFNRLDRPAPEMHGYLAPPAHPRIGSVTAFGFCLTFLGLGGFGTWAGSAPLASAVVASGIVVVDSSRKTVQHVDGGAVGELLVRDGDRVEAGQVLMRLDDLEAKSLHDLLDGRVLALWAQEARSSAEIAGASTLAFPTQIETLRTNPHVAAILDGQTKIFEASRAANQGQIDVLQKRIAQLKAQEAGLTAQIKATNSQSAFMQTELQDARQLHSRGLERKSRMLALERNAAKLIGDEGELMNKIGQTRESAASTEFEILNLERARIEKLHWSSATCRASWLKPKNG